MLGLLSAVSAFAAATVDVTEIVLPTYGYDDPDPVPTPAKRFWPYYRYDGFTDRATNRSWKAVVLENDAIRVAILPEIGGKVWGAVDKLTGEDFVYFNHVVKFRDISMCGPWTSGGIEFNFGIVGHGPYTSLPVDWTVRTNADGSASYFCGHTEMVTRGAWQVEVRLPATGTEFETRTFWQNGSLLRQPYYQWMNAGYGVKRENPEFVFPAQNYIGHPGDSHPWPVDEFGHDISVYSNNTFGVSWLSDNDVDHKAYHVLGGDSRFYGVWWPKAGFGAYHLCDVDQKYGRKVWLWGLSRLGGIWEDLLTDADGQYVELQSGRAFQQPQETCWRTPFRHPVFSPGATDRFVERWGMSRKRGLFDRYATSDAKAARPQRFPSDFDWQGVYGLYIRAKQAVYSGEKADDPEPILRELLGKDPCCVPALDLLAQELMRRGETAAARTLLDKALSVDTYDAEANYLDGVLALERGELMRARERLGLAAYGVEFRTIAETLIARAYLREGDASRARAAAEAALRADADNADARWTQVVALRLAGRTEEAKAELRQALEARPLCQALRYEAVKLGLEQDFGRLVSEHFAVETYIDLGGRYAAIGQTADAQSLYARAAGDVRAAVYAAYLTRDAASLRRAARLPTAFSFPFRREMLPALEWAAAADASWKFDYLLAQYLDANWQTARASELLAKCGEKPDEAAFYLYRAGFKKGAEARQDLSRAAQLCDSWRVGLALYRTYAAEGDWPAAKSSLADYLRRFPKNPGLQIAEARALVGCGEHEQAVEYLDGITFLPSELGEKPYPVYQEALVKIAEAALARGDRAKAERAVRKALSYPEHLGTGRPYDLRRVMRNWPQAVRELADGLADRVADVSIPVAALDPKGGHVQGVAVGEGAVYVSQMTQLTKLDWNGKVLAKRKVVSHTGDIAWWNGELYAAVAVYPDCKQGKIEVFDKDLRPVRETTIDRTVDGITCLDGVLYVGMGSKTPPSKNPHRVNVLGRFDAKTLKEIAPRQDFDYGYDTKYGFQDIATDGKLLYATFYAVAGAPQMAVFDKDGKIVGVSKSGSNQGFDFLSDKSGLLVRRNYILTVEPVPAVWR